MPRTVTAAVLACVAKRLELDREVLANVPVKREATAIEIIQEARKTAAHFQNLEWRSYTPRSIYRALARLVARGLVIARGGRNDRTYQRPAIGEP